MQVRNAADFDGETGGDQIQAAINDLPSRGGSVFIPIEDPGTVTNGSGVNESGVWEVTSTITVSDGVHIAGAGPGVSMTEHGTTLIATAVTTMVSLESQLFKVSATFVLMGRTPQHLFRPWRRDRRERLSGQPRHDAGRRRGHPLLGDAKLLDKKLLV
jgi:hypothetical protein